MTKKTAGIILFVFTIIILFIIHKREIEKDSFKNDVIDKNKKEISSLKISIDSIKKIKLSLKDSIKIIEKEKKNFTNSQ